MKEEKEIRVRLLYTKDLWGDFLVKLHSQDKKHRQNLYLFLAERGYDVLEKEKEFRLMGRIRISSNWEKDLKKQFRLMSI